MNLSSSIVTYKSSKTDLQTVIECINQSIIDKLYIVDNSPTDELMKFVLSLSDKIEYVFGHGNIGYGAGHNIAIRKSIELESKYHLVLNSDIIFNKNDIQLLLDKIDSNDQIGLIMPKILNIDRSIQYLPKLLPTPLNLLVRVLPFLNKLFRTKDDNYTLRNYSDIELNVPLISGCFSLFRVESLKKIGFYDDKFFMYFEDFDLSRRIHSKYITLYYPSVSIIHAHERGAAKNFKLFRIFIRSAFTYFSKYGFIFDNERKRINKTVLQSLK